MKNTRILLIALSLVLFASICHADRFIKLFNSLISNPTINDQLLSDAAKFDAILFQANDYDEYTGSVTSTRYHANADTWNSLDDRNSNILIYTYSTAWLVTKAHNCSNFPDLDTIAHYSINCSHSGGPLTDNDNQPGEDDYLLRDDTICEPENCTGSGTPCSCCSGLYDPGVQDNTGCSVLNGAVTESSGDDVILKFGKPAVTTWINEALADAWASREWAADGIFADGSPCVDRATNPWDYPSGTIEADYNTDAKWGALASTSWLAHQDFLNSNYSMGFMANAGSLFSQGCIDAWSIANSSADTSDTPGLALLYEHTFVSGFGTGDIWLLSGNDWYNALQLLDQPNISTIMGANSLYIGRSSDNCAVPGSCVDQWGNSVEYGDLLWYYLGSYVMGMTNRSYSSFYREYGITTQYENVVWSPVYDEMDEGDNLHLGAPRGDYQSGTKGGQTIYWREFDHGLDIVNSNNGATPTGDMSSSWNFAAEYDRVSKTLTYSNYDTANLFNGVDRSNRDETVQLDARQAIFVRFKEEPNRSFSGASF